MANQACIAIGINQYQFLPPLGYASTDAEGIEHFFVDSAGWPSERCLLMTDTSSPLDSRSTLPTSQNIREWLNNWCWDTLEPGDLLWFFFSGYGISNGETEYLMPIDGNPENLANTCISLKEIYRHLGSLGINVVVCLDTNRSQNMNFGTGIGNQVKQLAQEYQITTLLSCRSDEFSHEAAGLNHGLFTLALLEALRYHPDLNIDTLEYYLSSRLPELSEHHWRPTQTPIIIIPDQVSPHRPLFSATTQTAVAKAEDISRRFSPRNPDVSAQVRKRTIIPANSALAIRKSTPKKPKKIGYAIAGIVTGIGIGGFIILRNLPQKNNTVVSGPKANNSINSTIKPTIKSTPKSTVIVQNSLKPNPINNKPKSELLAADKLIQPGNANSYYQAIKLARKIASSEPEYTEAQQKIKTWDQEIYLIAKYNGKRGSYGEAIGAASLISRNSPNYQNAQKDIAQWEKKLGNTNPTQTP